VDTMRSSIAADFSEMAEVGRVADAQARLMSWSTLPALPPWDRRLTPTRRRSTVSCRSTSRRRSSSLPRSAPKIAARGGGSIINVSTMVASYGQPDLAAYGASRAAIELLTKPWAAEFGPQNVRVNAVAPGPTPAVDSRLAMATEFAKQIPLGRVADVHELSDVITFLATPAAGYINGAIIHVDGGRTAV